MKEPLQMQKEINRFIILEECEQRIYSACRRGLEATCALAKEFKRIDQEELYRERGYENFNAYALDYLQFSLPTVSRIKGIARGVDLIRAAGLRLPANETQLVELARIKDEGRQIEVWQRLLKAEEIGEKPLNARAVEKAVDMALETIEAAKEAAAAERPGVQTSLDIDAPGSEEGPNGAGKKTAPIKVPQKRLTFTERAEAALERIKRLCGKPVAEAIENGNHPISERDMIKWSEQEDEMVKRLAHYVSDMRWKVDKAIAFENMDIDMGITLERLRVLTLARGGRMRFELEDLKVLIEQLA